LLRLMGEDNKEGILTRNRLGGTALHSVANHNGTIQALQALRESNRQILRTTTFENVHAVSVLWHSFLSTIAGHMAVARILEGEEEDVRSSSHFDRFWNKVVYLSTEYYALREDLAKADPNHVLHGLLHCNVAINLFKVAIRLNPSHATIPDAAGNLPLHRLVEDRPFRLKEREAIESLLQAAPESASRPNRHGDFPLFLAIRQKMPLENGLDLLIATATAIVRRQDPETRLFPYQLAATVGGKGAVERTFHLLLASPDLLER
jgi:ankyrin repeat protein